MLGICAFRVERHISLKKRVTANCVQFVNQLVATSTPTTFAEHVRKRRLELKLSQKQLAKLLDSTHDTISSWELGQSKPQAKYRQRVVKWLGYDPDIPTT
ncbi:MAG: helix-turn-helix protein [Verrucomicrobiota bacterium]|jgi:DNA-binding transcriptional regulator YiaG